MFAGNRRASKIMKGIEFYAIASFLILDVFFCTKSVLLLMIVANYNYLCVFFCYRWATLHISFSAVK